MTNAHILSGSLCGRDLTRSSEVGFMEKVGSFQHYKTTMIAVFLSE
jgi:hypothetical protein